MPITLNINIRFAALRRKTQSSAYGTFPTRDQTPDRRNVFFHHTQGVLQGDSDIVTPDHADYAKAIARWAGNIERRARVVAFVKDTDDIALALKYARDNELQVARFAAAATAFRILLLRKEDGLVIDLSRHLHYAVVDPEKRTARVGGGALWGTVEKEAIQHGSATVAGSNSLVCIFYPDLYTTWH
jgi:FAD/FMN-containing dehydrogenase